MSEPYSQRDVKNQLYEATEPDINKLSLVIRKPQEGKTFICINKITRDKSRDIHIVLTMNTLASGMQFFGRMEKDVGSERIIVFNSNKSTAGDCHHAVAVTDIFRILRKNPDIKVIVCCAHDIRIRESIPSVLEIAEDSQAFKEYNRKFRIHVDEAHKYIPENREYIREYNASPIVTSIVGYSGTPDDIWEIKKKDPLFNNIPIEDVDRELSMIRSKDYFGVRDCEHNVINDTLNRQEILEKAKIPHEIPPWIVNKRDIKPKARTWCGEKYPFQWGNELLHLSTLKVLLSSLTIPKDSFSYHYIPAYTRMATHDKTVSIVTRQFPNANVIVMNGDGIVLWRRNKDGTLTPHDSASLISKDEKILEPSAIIQKLIQKTSSCPTFVTGHNSVGMSVTLINEGLCNFDTVLFTHSHLIKKDKDFSADIYQLCRFLFNYTSWSPEGRKRIKTTKLYCLTKEILEDCLGYEEHVELLSTDYAGKNVSLRKVLGLGEFETSDRKKKEEDLLSIGPTDPNTFWKKFKVYDGNDEEEWERVKVFYKKITGKELKGRSMPKRKNGFYECSATKRSKETGKKFLDVQTSRVIDAMKSQSWWSTFALTKGKLSYARVFVGHESRDDPSEYTIYVKYVQLANTEEVHAILEKYGGKQRSGDTSSVVSDATETDAEPEPDSEEENILLGTV
jgi:hypothetical protein